jgi:hypothetical protein
MKSHPVPSISIAESPRCLFRTQNGQCRMLAVDFSATLCLYHARQAMPQVPDTVDLLQSLTQPPTRFHNPQAITDALASLFSLVAQGRISPRRATALAYIANLMLHNLPAPVEANTTQREALSIGESTPSSPKCSGQSSDWPAANTNSPAVNAARASAPAPKSQPLPDTVEGFLAAVRNQIDTTRDQRNTS